MKLLGKNKSRPKLSFALGSKWKHLKKLISVSINVCDKGSIYVSICDSRDVAMFSSFWCRLLILRLPLASLFFLDPFHCLSPPVRTVLDRFDSGASPGHVLWWLWETSSELLI
jgi:hypothetical protein